MRLEHRLHKLERGNGKRIQSLGYVDPVVIVNTSGGVDDAVQRFRDNHPRYDGRIFVLPDDGRCRRLVGAV